MFAAADRPGNSIIALEQTAVSKLLQTQTVTNAVAKAAHDEPPAEEPGHKLAPGPGLGVDHLYHPTQFFGITAQQTLYSDPSRAGGAKRTEVRSSTGLAQHQRVHDADDSGFVHDPEDRSDSYFDPRQNVVFQTGIHERSERRRRKIDWSKRKRSGDGTTPVADGLEGDVLHTVFRVVQAMNFVDHHAHPAPGTAIVQAAVTRELALALRGLIRSASTPPRRRYTLTGRTPGRPALPRPKR